MKIKKGFDMASHESWKKKFGNSLFRQSTLDILLTISNFVTTCQLIIIIL